MKTPRNKFYNINAMVNANVVPMVDSSKWIAFSLHLKKRAFSLRTINRIAELVTQ
jgi:hypothetical protein